MECVLVFNSKSSCLGLLSAGIQNPCPSLCIRGVFAHYGLSMFSEVHIMPAVLCLAVLILQFRDYYIGIYIYILTFYVCIVYMYVCTYRERNSKKRKNE
jgi:Ca2+/Na+ antiporter